MEKIKGFKAFDKNLKCCNFQYEIGKEYTEYGAIQCCNNGFHFCENPLDLFRYYSPSYSRYCKVEGDGKIDRDFGKVAVSHIYIGEELDIINLVKAGVKFTLDKVKQNEVPETDNSDCSITTNTGEYSTATNEGDNSAAMNLGDCSIATNTGNHSIAAITGGFSIATNVGYSSVAASTAHESVAVNTGVRSIAANTGTFSVAINTGLCSSATNTSDHSAAINRGVRSVAINTGFHSSATVEGKDSIAIATGKESKASGALGCWIVLTEYDEDGHIADVKAVKVDGTTTKADTYYTLKNGEITEVKE